MHAWKKIGIAAGLTAATAVSIALAAPASADTAAQSGDAVGVGSDTLQNGADFVFDGSPGVAGGFNAGNLNRAVNVFSTGDANGRALYDGTCGAADSTGTGQFCNATTNQAPNNLVGSVILRAGTKPVIRPNGSGAGAAALIADSGTGYQGLPTGSLQFARMSRLPNAGEESNCPTTVASCGGLHVYQAATDTLGIAHASAAFNGPAGLSADELYKIFVTCSITKWNQLPGNDSGSGNTIHPLIPQSGSGTRNFFLADLATSQGMSGTTLNPGSCTRTVQEHDPTGIYADSSTADAIEPFSSGKLALINKGYFTSGVSYQGTNAANGAYTPNFLTLESGNPGDSNPNYNSTRGLYFAVRQADVNSNTPFEPGGTQNFVQSLFTGSQSAIRSGNGRAELAYAGFTASYKDCNINPTTC